MTAHPELVAGPERYDTLVMRAAAGKLVSKGGAEAYQAMGIAPGVLGPGSPALGVAIKVSDGDRADRAISTAALAVLVQLGVLTPQERSQLSRFDRRPINNWRGIEVGEIRPAFHLNN